MPKLTPKTLSELQAARAYVNAAPKNSGIIHRLCLRPKEGARLYPSHLDLSVSGGVSGDRWLTHTWIHLPDGSPDPRIQVCILQKRVLDLVWLDREKMPYPADNIIVDMDLSEGNLPTGTRLKAGSAVLEVSDVFNTACRKWYMRYGKTSLHWINRRENRQLRLRGILCKIVSDGKVTPEDRLRKL